MIRVTNWHALLKLQLSTIQKWTEKWQTLVLKKDLIFTDLKSKVDTINSDTDIESDIWYHVNSGTRAQPLEGAVKMKFMAKIKCPIWQLLATTHAHCHKCGRLALTISYSAPHQSQKSKQSRQVIYSSGFCELDFYTYSVFRLYSIIFCGLVFFCRFFFSIRLVL